MSYTNKYESRLVRQLDHKRANDVDLLTKSFKLAFESRVLSDTEHSREPIKNGELLAKVCCIHAVPYLFRDTRYGCKRCGFWGRGNI